MRPPTTTKLISLAGLLALLGTPTVAQARAGGKLLVFMYAAPLVLPVLGLFAALVGLRISSSRRLWWFLCGLLGLNAVLLGALIGHAEGAPIEALFVVAHVALALAMLSTTTAGVSKLRTVAQRIPGVAAFGAIPALLSWLLAR